MCGDGQDCRAPLAARNPATPREAFVRRAALRWARKDEKQMMRVAPMAARVDHGIGFRDAGDCLQAAPAVGEPIGADGWTAWAVAGDIEPE